MILAPEDVFQELGRVLGHFEPLLSRPPLLEDNTRRRPASKWRSVRRSTGLTGIGRPGTYTWADTQAYRPKKLVENIGTGFCSAARSVNLPYVGWWELT